MKVLDYDGLEYYNEQIEDKYATKNSPALTGTPTAPTSTASDDSTKIATTAFVHDNTDDKLPLSGGTMTGAIETSYYIGMRKDTDTSYIDIYGGTNWNKGGGLGLYGKDSTNALAGGFVLRAHNGTTNKDLQGKPDGTLTWGGTAISLNGHTHSYLPLSGGTLTGALNFANNTWNKLGDDSFIGDHNVGGKLCVKSQTSTATGIAFFNNSDTNVGQVEVNNAFNFNKTIQQNGIAVSLSNHNHDSAYASKSVVDNIGTVTSKTNSSDVSIAASTGKTITSISLAAGKWVVTGHARYTSVTANKSYGIMLTTTNNGFNLSNDGSISVQSANANSISLQVAKIVTLSSTTTVYLTAYSTAASTIGGGIDIVAVRIK